MAGNAEIRAKWIFGTAPSGEGGAVLGSTGTGTRVNINGFAEEQMFYIETDAACTCSYQLLVWRNQTGGASQVLSSGTLSTSQLDVIHITGPLAFVAPRIKTINSTANGVVVELYGV